MSNLFGDGQKKPETAGTAAHVQKYEYMVCPKRWNPKERAHEGCGKYYMADSFITECPDCGRTLLRVWLDAHPKERVPRILFKKCVKCAHNLGALPCIGDFPQRPEYCNACSCRKCCEDISGKADRVIRKEYSLGAFMKDGIREHMEREAKEREAKAKAEGIAVVDTVAQHAKPVAGANPMAKPIVDPNPMAIVLGKAFDGEIPF